MITALIILFGLGIGSFLNVVIARLYHQVPFFKQRRSICFDCRKSIAWYDNIPVLSYLVLGGKCRQCHKPISLQYPLVEIATAAIALLLYYEFGLGVDFVAAAIFSVFLIIIFVYDARYYIIPDIFSLPALTLSFAINLFRGVAVSDLLLGIVIGGGFFLIQFVVSRGRWIGGGDIRLGAVMGAMLGWKLTILALGVAYVVGAIVGVGLLLFGKKKMSSAMPFGTCLTAATFFALVYGYQTLHWYLGILGLPL